MTKTGKLVVAVFALLLLIIGTADLGNPQGPHKLGWVEKVREAIFFAKLGTGLEDLEKYQQRGGEKQEPRSVFHIFEYENTGNFVGDVIGITLNIYVHRSVENFNFVGLPLDKDEEFTGFELVDVRREVVQEKDYLVLRYLYKIQLFNDFPPDGPGYVLFPGFDVGFRTEDGWNFYRANGVIIRVNRLTDPNAPDFLTFGPYTGLLQDDRVRLAKPLAFLGALFLTCSLVILVRGWRRRARRARISLYIKLIHEVWSTDDLHGLVKIFRKGLTAYAGSGSWIPYKLKMDSLAKVLRCQDLWRHSEEVVFSGVSPNVILVNKDRIVSILQTIERRERHGR